MRKKVAARHAAVVERSKGEEPPETRGKQVNSLEYARGLYHLLFFGFDSHRACVTDALTPDSSHARVRRPARKTTAGDSAGEPSTRPL
ncbi:hypothetical protein PR202_gb16143 [Eleusine coracana subsp. coracana]|uniref:Uncharacterized protein n=1 Tax=Eleusine coracana subsp. coracana TaxID=191504 RepID=A0AAV5EZU7_ELECO|nr:hypothetical protein PR202_gb16129 [Eleusine coracana subsp. coracana]GJN28062.1 hypothetical protein PR202_gb16143 [Eleusine coracana subsp. coracana]